MDFPKLLNNYFICVLACDFEDCFIVLRVLLLLLRLILIIILIICIFLKFMVTNDWLSPFWREVWKVSGYCTCAASCLG